MRASRVLVPLPGRDVDPTEVAVGWKVLTARGHSVVFATPNGQPAAADDIMINGRGLDPWGWIPVLGNVALVGRFMRANADGRVAYRELRDNPAFQHPLSWDEIRSDDADALYLPGGHRARGMRTYLESPLLQQKVAEFFAAGKPVAAVCHGVLLAARSTDPATGHSVLFGRKTTALTWRLEKLGWSVARWTRFWDPGYFRTYPDGPGQPTGYMSVQQEVTRALAHPADFLDVPVDAPDYKARTDGRHRDSATDASPAFVVRDGNYVSARWPGDVHTFAATFASVLAGDSSLTA
jgi:putative intracellular protease/amidase